MDTRAIFARNLSRLVMESGMEQQALAFALDVSPSIVSSWLSGKRFPRADMMSKIADYFHVDISDIVEESKDKQTPYNPKHRILFDRTKELTDKQMDIVMNVVDGLLGREDDSI